MSLAELKVMLNFWKLYAHCTLYFKHTTMQLPIFRGVNTNWGGVISPPVPAMYVWISGAFAYIYFALRMIILIIVSAMKMNQRHSLFPHALPVPLSSLLKYSVGIQGW